MLISVDMKRIIARCFLVFNNSAGATISIIGTCIAHTCKDNV